MRVITVQGPTQLLSIIAILKYQQSAEAFDSAIDVLVMGGFYSEHYAQLIRTCKVVSSQWSFSQVIVVGINLSLSCDNPGSHYPTISRMQHLASADYVYVSRNWQPFNEAFIDLCKSAKVICYGDGLIGGLDSLMPAKDSGYLERNRLRLNKIIMHDPPDLSGFAYPHDAIRDILTVVPISFLKSVIATCSPLFPGIARLNRFCAEGIEQNLSLVALSNQSESGVVRRNPVVFRLTMLALWLNNSIRNVVHAFGLTFLDSLPNLVLSPLFRLVTHKEILMYEEYLLRHIDRSEKIILKAHPRQSLNQANILASRLRKCGFRVYAADMALSAVPIELFFGTLRVQKFFAMGSGSAITISMFSCWPDMNVYEQIDVDIRRKYLSGFALPPE